MTENSGATILLGVIAMSAIVQAVLICGIALGGRRLTQRIDELPGQGRPRDPARAREPLPADAQRRRGLRPRGRAGPPHRGRRGRHARPPGRDAAGRAARRAGADAGAGARRRRHERLPTRLRRVPPARQPRGTGPRPAPASTARTSTSSSRRRGRVPAHALAASPRTRPAPALPAHRRDFALASPLLRPARPNLRPRSKETARMKTLAVTLLCSASAVAASASDVPALEARVAAIVARSRSTVGVGLRDLASGETVLVRGRDHFPMFSVYKLPIAMRVLQRVDEGALRLADPDRDRAEGRAARRLDRGHPRLRDGHGTMTVAELVQAAVAQSDNTASDVILRLAGGPEAVTAYVRSLGIEGLRVDRPEVQMAADTKGVHAGSERRAAIERYVADPRDSATPEAALALLRASRSATRCRRRPPSSCCARSSRRRPAPAASAAGCRRARSSRTRPAAVRRRSATRRPRTTSAWSRCPPAGRSRSRSSSARAPRTMPAATARSRRSRGRRSTTGRASRRLKAPDRSSLYSVGIP